MLQNVVKVKKNSAGGFATLICDNFSKAMHNKPRTGIDCQGKRIDKGRGEFITNEDDRIAIILIESDG